MFFFIIALLIGEYCLALIIKAVFRMKFEPLLVPIVTVVVGFAVFFVVIVVGFLYAITSMTSR